ncbi:hypothetical protein HMPREF1979_01745 [Actinomyces johnsonii F0542]|uniref:Uncharacterized protein n=1 Tax=Actinomyces johnsonii F0542 TaxID=1321818 RepID=U1QNA1_9ACTO|nr:hypothetical protein HMPREF1979_01745 [Actinomyces johnsonii F0542]
MESSGKVDVSWIMVIWFDVQGVNLPKVQPAAGRLAPSVRPSGSDSVARTTRDVIKGNALRVDIK